MTFEPQTPDFERRVRESFGRQKVMETMGARLARVVPGEVEINLPFREELTQQHGFLHAGIVTTIADSACGYAAFSLMPPESSVLTIEYKVNLLAPAKGEHFMARGRVVRAGGTLTICSGEVEAHEGGQDKLVAVMLSTMMRLKGRPGVPPG
ncbi:MAG: PaaI family thioesterase [Actinomycetota bacterium]|nr:PaaI family thioesterase [Actinomycetota bacterium]